MILENFHHSSIIKPKITFYNHYQSHSIFYLKSDFENIRKVSDFESIQNIFLKKI